MKIDRNLNLVIPVEIEPEELDDKGQVRRPAQHYYVHASPISLETFEENVFLLAKAFNRTLAAGANLGPRIAASLLKQTAVETFGRTRPSRATSSRRFGACAWSRCPPSAVTSPCRLRKPSVPVAWTRRTCRTWRMRLFFLAGLASDAEGGEGDHGSGRSRVLRRVDHVLELYGLRSFLDDVDAAREYWRDGSAANGHGLGQRTSIVAAVLDLAVRVFDDVMAEKGYTWSSAAEFRNRHLARAVASVLKA